MTNAEVAVAFSAHQFESVYEFLADNITWDNVGGEMYTGKDEVVAACKQALDYFAGVKSTINSMTAHEGGRFVTVEVDMTYTEENDMSRVASCDVYGFKDSKITLIRSYNVELKT